MADEGVKMSLFNWVTSTIITAISAGLAWLGMHTKRLNEINAELKLLKQSNKNLADSIDDAATRREAGLKVMQAGVSDMVKSVQQISDRVQENSDHINHIQYDKTYSKNQNVVLLTNLTEMAIEQGEKTKQLEKRIEQTENITKLPIQIESNGSRT